jgi:phosphatidylglycerol lysyltransferase
MPIKRLAFPRPASRVLRLTFPFAVTALCLWVLHDRVALPSLGDLETLLRDVTPGQWLAALAATLVSFWALGRYDSVAHRHLATGLDGPRARKSGAAAIALSQTVGFGLVSGSYARWRLLPGLTPLQSVQLTSFVAVTFLAALAAVCGFACLSGAAGAAMQWFGAVILLGVGASTLLSFVFPEVPLGKRRFQLPSLTAMAALGVWTMIDVAAAGTALWILLPETLEISWPLLLSAYFIALGAAVISSAPGGVGPFELTLVALLPMAGSEELMAGILAFRLVYYALPALLAGIAISLPKVLEEDGEREAAPAGEGHRLPHDRPRSETAVIRQNGGDVIGCGTARLAVLDSPQASIALFDPVAGCAAPALKPLQRRAKGRNAAACFYKCSARTALKARAMGWQVLRIAEEAVLNPQSYSDDGSARRQLRRKLRQAEKKGLEVRPAAGHLPLEQMETVDAAWQGSHGRALGTTMGRFEPAYLMGQRVFLGWLNGRIIAFTSFHESAGEWCLDLMRITPGAPDGTGHSLVRAAIDAARAEGITRLSLAAAPDHRLAPRVDKGLRRFKTCFAPRWEPLYMAAPNWWQMTISAAELIRLVHRPPRLDQANADAAPAETRPHPHNEDEENAFAIARRA